MKQNIWLFAVAFLLMACGVGDYPGEDPIICKDYIEVSHEVVLESEGQSVTLRISSNCSWAISVTGNWLSLSSTTGNNNQTITVSAEKNLTNIERSATLTILAGTAPVQTVKVTQKKTDEVYSLSVDVNTLSFEAKGESKTVVVNSNTSWRITKPEWCTISQSSGSGNATITVTASENPNQEQRTGQIVVSGDNVTNVTIAVSQKAKESSDDQEPGKDDNLPPS